MTHVKAFIGGFVSTLVFHQGLLGLLYAAGVSPRAPYATQPTWPFHVPQVISLALWGGVWGIVLWMLIRGTRSAAAYWLLALVIGALGPSLVALFVVFPLKGLGVAGGWQAKIIVGALLLNGVWGIGVALFMRLFAREASPSPA